MDAQGGERSRTWQNAFEAQYGAWEIGSKPQTGGFVVLEDDALLHPDRQFPRDASAYLNRRRRPSGGGSPLIAFRRSYPMSCETPAPA